MCSEGLLLSTYIIVGHNTTQRFCVLGSGRVEVTLGGTHDGCVLMMDASALRRFLTMGREALREMDATFDRECAQREAS